MAALSEKNYNNNQQVMSGNVGVSKKANNLSAKTSKGRMFGCEAIIPEHPFLEDWGGYYQSILRTAVREMIDGAGEKDIEKSFQTRFNIRWSWADSIAKEAAQKVAQLKTARANQISALRDSRVFPEDP